VRPRHVVAAVWVLAAAGLMAGAGLATPVAQAPPAAGSDLSVMAFNIRYGTANDGDNHWLERREMVFDVIRTHRPDVVGLQEALRGQLDEVLQAVPDYVFVEPGVEVIEAAIVRDARDGRYPSDHFPVTARLRLR